MPKTMRPAILAFSLVVAIIASCQADGTFVFPDQIDGFKHAPTSVASDIKDKVNDGDVVSKEQNSSSSSSKRPQPATDNPTSTSTPKKAVHVLPEKWENHVISIISRGITKFTLKMDRAIHYTTPRSSENLIFSPVSLSLTLAMVMLAANGKTFDEFSQLLGLETGIDISHHSEVVHQILGLLLDELERRQKLDKTAPHTDIAFSIFVEDGFPVREQFRKVSHEVYSSEVTSVDFSTDPLGSMDAINNWVSEKTNGKIANLLQNPPNPSTEVLIASALYFSGEWGQHFMDGATRKKKFTVSENETVYVDLMTNAGYFPFHEDKQLGLKIIGFPYKANDVTMYAILPTKGTGVESLDEIKSHLTPELIENLIWNMKNSSCIVGFPRMKLSSNLKLRGALKALGLKSLFDPQTADLSILSPGRNASEAAAEEPTTDAATPAPTSGSSPTSTPRAYRIVFPGYDRKKRQIRPIDQDFINFLGTQNLTKYGVDELRHTPNLSNPGLYADDVLHKVEMTIDERGTEAAAATSTTIDRSNEAKRFIANRPFLFFIRHDVGKIIWFWGTINKPAPAYDSL